MCKLLKDCNLMSINLACCVTGHAAGWKWMRQTDQNDTESQRYTCQSKMIGRLTTGHLFLIINSPISERLSGSWLTICTLSFN